MTECEWLEDQYETWGYDYIEDLINKGFVPVKTPAGWRWLLDKEHSRVIV